MPRLHRAAALLLLAWGSSGPCLADNNNCEAIRAQIDAKVRGSGAKDYAVTIVGADAKVAGKVVGTCDLGTKKIVYMRSTRDDEIITECRDGRVVRGGDCK